MNNNQFNLSTRPPRRPALVLLGVIFLLAALVMTIVFWIRGGNPQIDGLIAVLYGIGAVLVLKGR